MRPGYIITIPSVNEKPGEETATRLHRTRPAEKIIMIIFWDKHGILQTKYLPGGTAISVFYYVSIIERFRCIILEKHRGEVSVGMLLLHDNALVDKCNIVQAAVGKADFVELNHPAYYPDIAPSDYYLFSNLKKYLRGKNFSCDDGRIDTVEDYLNRLD